MTTSRDSLPEAHGAGESGKKARSAAGLWLPVAVALPRHRKLRRLAQALGINRYEALGRLFALWAAAMEQAPTDGVLAGHDAEDIADAMGWDGDPEALVGALEAAGLLDREGAAWAIHDWADYGGKMMERRQANAERQATFREKRRQGQGEGTPTGLPEEVTVTANGHSRDVTVTKQLGNALENRTGENTTGQDTTGEERTGQHPRERGVPPLSHSPLTPAPDGAGSPIVAAENNRPSLRVVERDGEPGESATPARLGALQREVLGYLGERSGLLPSDLVALVKHGGRHPHPTDNGIRDSLKKLARQGLVTRRDDNRTSETRYLWSLTERGREALAELAAVGR